MPALPEQQLYRRSLRARVGHWVQSIDGSRCVDVADEGACPERGLSFDQPGLTPICQNYVRGTIRVLVLRDVGTQVRVERRARIDGHGRPRVGRPRQTVASFLVQNTIATAVEAVGPDAVLLAGAVCIVLDDVLPVIGDIRNFSGGSRNIADVEQGASLANASEVLSILVALGNRNLDRAVEVLDRPVERLR